MVFWIILNNYAAWSHTHIAQEYYFSGLFFITYCYYQQSQQPPPNGSGSVPREKIWSGVPEWIEKAKAADQLKVTHEVVCQVTPVTTKRKDGELEM